LAPLAQTIASSDSLDFEVLVYIFEAQMKKHSFPEVSLAVVQGSEIVYPKDHRKPAASRQADPASESIRK
jgi:hypothetical protein